MKSILDRLSEPSSYAALGVLLTLFGISDPDPTLMHSLSLFLAGVAGLAGFFLREKGGGNARR